MSDAKGDGRESAAPVEQAEAARLVEQREEQVTATDWFFSHAVRMRAAYRPEPAERVVEDPDDEDPAP